MNSLAKLAICIMTINLVMITSNVSASASANATKNGVNGPGLQCFIACRTDMVKCSTDCFSKVADKLIKCFIDCGMPDPNCITKCVLGNGLLKPKASPPITSPIPH